MMEIAKSLAKAEGEGRIVVGKAHYKAYTNVLIDPYEFELKRKKIFLKEQTK
jgi:hypothetical protein